jgi:hypothetical protein
MPLPSLKVILRIQNRKVEDTTSGPAQPRVGLKDEFRYIRKAPVLQINAGISNSPPSLILHLLVRTQSARHPQYQYQKDS